MFYNMALYRFPTRILTRIPSPYQILTRQVSDVSAEEVKIKVPWGHIAGRLWNGSDASKTPVLCIHGWKDNAASFDRLIPLLIPALNQYQFLSIDLPGHGLSSHYPPGMAYHLWGDSFDWVLRIMEHYSWSNVTIMGHSMGAIIGFLFASTHVAHVNNLIAIDGLAPIVISHLDMLQMVPRMSEDLIRMEDKQNKLSLCTEAEILLKMRNSHMMGMNETACKALITRGAKESETRSGQFHFTHDLRVQYLPITTLSNRQISFLAKNFQSGLLYLKALDGVNYMSNYLNVNIIRWIKMDNKKPVQFFQLENSVHHVHLIQPEVVAAYVTEFLLKQS